MLYIAENTFQRLTNQLFHELPQEGCGYLGGRADLVSDIYPMRNALNSPTEFEFDPPQQFEALRHFRHHGMDIVGVYHSHPFGTAYPSDKDIEAAESSYYQLIVVPCQQNPVCRCFTIISNKVSEVELNIIR